MVETIQSVDRKLCCSCNKDVTQGKRMKDREGKYWCLECGIADQLKKGGASGASMCPECDRPTAMLDLVKHGTRYICNECHHAISAIESRKMTGSAALKDPAKRIRLALAVLMLAASAALITSFYMGII